MRIRLLRYTVLVMIILCQNRLYAQNSADSSAIKRTELVAVQFGYGNYKTLIRTSFFTQRWRHSYWSPICGVLGGELGNFDDFALFIGGTCAGIRKNLGSSKQHEIRVGTGLAFGYSRLENDGFNAGNALGFGPAWNGNLSYIWRVRERFAWQASVYLIDFLFEHPDYNKPQRSRAYFLGILY